MFQACQDLRAHVRTGSTGIGRIRYADGTDLTVKPNSVVQVVGGEAEGMWVRLGKVLIRARRLLTSGEEQTFRSPIAVAAVRGTEFGMMVEEDVRYSSVRIRGQGGRFKRADSGAGGAGSGGPHDNGGAVDAADTADDFPV